MESLQEEMTFDKEEKARYFDVMERLWSIHYSRFAVLLR